MNTTNIFNDSNNDKLLNAKEVILYILSGIFSIFFGIIHFQLKRYMKRNDKQIIELKNEIETLSVQSSQRTNIQEQETPRRINLEYGTAPYANDNVIYIDELMKSKSLHIGGYDIELVKTDRSIKK